MRARMRVRKALIAGVRVLDLLAGAHGAAHRAEGGLQSRFAKVNPRTNSSNIFLYQE